MRVLVACEFSGVVRRAFAKPQEEWRDWCNKNSIPWALCRGIGDVQVALLDWNVHIKARAA